MARSPGRRCVRAFLLLALMAPLARAEASAGVGVEGQTLYGSIVGTVKDSSGAAVPGVAVTATNRETNLRLHVASNESGAFTFTNVQPGAYDLSASLAGFKELTRTGVPVTVGTVSRVDMVLAVGDLQEVVTVASEAALLQTDKADTRTEFKSKEITDLPLSNFRNYQSLLDLVPGATPSDFQNNEIDTPGRALQTTVNGTNPNNNNTRVDGATNANTWLPHHTLYVPPAETIDSVNISTSSFEADQGMAGGASIAVTTKSGTNQLRGSAFAFYTDEHLRSRTYFGRRNNDRLLPARHNIDGATLGGPIVRNRLFFFGAFEGQYRPTQVETTWSIPSLAMRTGDFSGVSQIVYDPLTGTPDGRNRQPFPGNKIPADRLSAMAQRINAFYPQPTTTGNRSNFAKSYVTQFRRNSYDLKINWNRSSTQQAWAKFAAMDAEVSNLERPGFTGGGLGKTTTYVGTIGYTWTLSPKLVVDSTIGYSTLDQWGRGPDYGTNYGSEVLGLPNTNGPDPRQSGFPQIANGFDNIGSEGAWYPYNRNDPSYTFATNVTRLVRGHQFRFGGTVDRLMMNHWQPEFGVGPRGQFDFSGRVTALRGGPQTSNYVNQYAAFLLGMPTQARKSVQTELMSTREWRFGLYIGDRWQVNDRLTVTLGLRWEYYPLVTRDGRGIERLDLDTMDVLLGGLGGNSDNLDIRTSKTDFAPRIGVAYRMNAQTVVRSGYSLTYNPLPFSRPLRGFYPLTAYYNFVTLNDWQPLGRLEDGLPDAVNVPPDTSQGRVFLPAYAETRTPDPDNVRRGRLQSWNLTVERRLPLDVSVSVGYVGTKTSRGFADRNINWSPPGGGETGRQFYGEFAHTANILWWGGIAEANYHSLQVAINRPFKRGLLLKGAYTWSKAMNMADEDGWVGLTWNSDDNFDRNYARSGRDRPHIFQLAAVYALPFGRGGGRSLVNAIVRDWQLNGIVSAYSGTPFTIVANADSVASRGDQQTADQVGPVRRMDGSGPDLHYFDPSAWSRITEQRFGNSGRNSVRGPGRYNLDLSIFRSFRLGGPLQLQVRAEGFNLTNHRRWPNPINDQNNAEFMETNSAPGYRNVRFAGRLSW